MSDKALSSGGRSRQKSRWRCGRRRPIILGMPELSPTGVLDALASDHSLQPFVRDGRIELMPAKRSRRLKLLEAVVCAFEPGARYSEQQVDGLLSVLHQDHCALRRYLVDEELLERDHGQYWRIGGPPGV